ncbi:CatB-related O-acetyltransferase [Polymorphobacter megasporae]|uniref:CatB-related O-acetyltransferase n=1 Tax=Glacieibacterium megasporae TaxID=2835787 RepID=UPI001C1DF8D0|nr:CatB-related O-acetyltransferase [Polymorphobacter megasporae]UAJ12691.1 CatB-related O-acetyltransferase [Polymorphobacter megasporae]
MGIVGSIIEKARLRILLRNEYESLSLRRWFSNSFDVDVGLYSYGCFDRWRVPPRTRIGRYSSFAKSARVLDANHPVEALSTHPFLYEKRFGLVSSELPAPQLMIIQDDVWLSHNVTVTPSCKFIGRGAIIGAGAVVTSRVEPYTIVAGTPAKIIRYRFDQKTIDAIEETKWWELTKEELSDLVKTSPLAVFHPTVSSLARLLSSGMG